MATRAEDLAKKLNAATIVFTFSGQGSQTYHMGKTLYERHPVFRDWMLRLDAMVSERSGESVVEHLYSAARHRADVFDDIRFTHPAIFMVEFSMAQVLKANGIEPQAVMGASLGEYCAATLAGLISLEDAVASVVAQAQIYHRHCSTGGMLAVLAPTSLYRRIPLFREHTEIASFNYESNFVVAGAADALDRVQARLKQEDVISLRLPVRQAFHSALMDPSRAEVLRQTSSMGAGTAHIPFISCATGSMLTALDRDYFWSLVRKPIRISQAIEYLEARGSHLYLDVGPGGTFANLIKYNARTSAASRAYPLFTPFGRDMEALSAVLSAVGNSFPSQKMSLEKQK